MGLLSRVGIGAALGGLAGGRAAPMDGENPVGDMAMAMGTGALLGGAGGAAVSGAMGLKNLVMGVAQMLKKQRPDLPDEVVLQEAVRRAQTLSGQKLQDTTERLYGEQISAELADFHARNRF